MGRSGPCVVRASLADQAEAPSAPRPQELAIALGANLPSPAGAPLATLLAVRPQLEQVLREWREAFHRAPAEAAGGLSWSPLFRTAPVGGPADQPAYLNAVLLLEAAGHPSCTAARALLERLHELERRFGRRRRERWGPRSLDLDLLWWGELRCSGGDLELPHPRWRRRAFVLAPLAAIAPGLRPAAAGATCGALHRRLLAEALAEAGEAPPERLAGRAGWPE
jgi:2-amino-4-hydroxy-6-hydroxymethyldihydropteridine diphosphokinase